MGQKINPVGFRTGVFLPWKSRWFSDDVSYKDLLIEDIKIRSSLMEKLKLAGIIEVEIERLPKSIVITLTVARPGVVIGRGGTGIEDVKKYILEIMRKTRKTSLKDLKIDIKVNEIKNPEAFFPFSSRENRDGFGKTDAFRRIVARNMERVMSSGALGIKVVLSGRIGGAEISRVEEEHTGSVPTQTLRENIDYAEIPALLKRGYVGVKVWIHKKEEE